MADVLRVKGDRMPSSLLVPPCACMDRPRAAGQAVRVVALVVDADAVLEDVAGAGRAALAEEIQVVVAAVDVAVLLEDRTFLGEGQAAVTAGQTVRMENLALHADHLGVLHAQVARRAFLRRDQEVVLVAVVADEAVGEEGVVSGNGQIVDATVADGTTRNQPKGEGTNGRNGAARGAEQLLSRSAALAQEGGERKGGGGEGREGELGAVERGGQSEPLRFEGRETEADALTQGQCGVRRQRQTSGSAVCVQSKARQ